MMLGNKELKKSGSGLEPLSAAQISEALQGAFAENLIPHNTRAVLFHDLGLFRERIRALQSTFPKPALHAIAIKANPLVEVLKHAVAAGAGLEAASLEEVYVALAAKCPPERIVFDSPAKTIDEIAEALKFGICLNADNYVELERIDHILRSTKSRSRVGLRVNPAVGSGTIGITSVGDADSRFGISIDQDLELILDAYDSFPWLTGIHCHVGSQGCSMDLLVNAAKKIGNLIVKIGERRQPLQFVDIGGGLPTVYLESDRAPTFEEYSSELVREAPQLFNSEAIVITEFGRAIQAGCGFALSRVEYTKSRTNDELAVTHLGADMFMRPVYLPSQWQHRCFAVNAIGEIKNGPLQKWTVGGPLCFAGDVVLEDAALPALEVGDHIVFRDTGAYTLSMWSRHCSRGMPLVLGYDGLQFSTLRDAESPADIARFWSLNGWGTSIAQQ